MPQPPKNTREFSSLLEVVKALRGPKGCPWDKEQNHQSLTRYAIEEAFELCEAIDQLEKEGSESSHRALIEELGDLLFQVVLHAEVARQEERFEIADVIEAINSKMIRRHPHVFSDLEVSGTEEVIKNWSQIKAEEKKTLKPESQQKPFDVPGALPALLRAHKIGEKTKALNFDWPDWSSVLDKVDEELGELKEALESEGLERQKEELGDVLFSLAQLARHLGIDPEQALRQTNQRFEGRFVCARQMAQEQGLDWLSLGPKALEELWTQAKKQHP